MKVLVQFERPPSYIRFFSETLNGVVLPNGNVQLKNSSLLRRNLAYNDEVVAVELSGLKIFSKTAKASSFSSLRIYSKKNSKNLLDACKFSDSRGAGSSYSSDERLALITVPPDVDFWKIDSELRKMLGKEFIFFKMAVRHPRLI